MRRMTVGNAGMGPSGNSYIHAHEHYTLHDEHHVSSGNSVGVAIPQPRVEVRSASTLGMHTEMKCYSVGVAFSRRRYPQQDNCKNRVGGNHKIENNAYG